MRYAAYYGGVLDKVGREFRGGNRARAMAAVAREYPNIQSALQWMCGRSELAADALRMVGHLYYDWLHQGQLAEGIAWLDKTLQAGRELPCCTPAVKARHGIGVLFWAKGEREAAGRYVRLSLEEAREVGDPALLFACLRLQAQILLQPGDSGEALNAAEESVRHARQAEDEWNLASALSLLGNILFTLNHSERAEPALKESAVLFEKVGDDGELSGPLRTLGYVALNAGRFEPAKELFKRSISVCRTHEGFGFGFLSRGLEGLASSFRCIGEFHKAAVLLGASEGLLEKQGTRMIPQFRQWYDRMLRLSGTSAARNSSPKPRKREEA